MGAGVILELVAWRDPNRPLNRRTERDGACKASRSSFATAEASE